LGTLEDNDFGIASCASAVERKQSLGQNASIKNTTLRGYLQIHSAVSFDLRSWSATQHYCACVWVTTSDASYVQLGNSSVLVSFSLLYHKVHLAHFPLRCRSFADVRVVRNGAQGSGVPRRQGNAHGSLKSLRRPEGFESVVPMAKIIMPHGQGIRCVSFKCALGACRADVKYRQDCVNYIYESNEAVACYCHPA
jgi:hypothetical protein